MARESRLQKRFLLLLVVLISAAFLFIIRDFLMIIVLAAVFAGVAHPVYEALVEKFKGREAAASLTTILLLFLLVVGPLAMVGTIVVNQAIHVSQNIRPRVQQLVNQPSLLDDFLGRLPFYDRWQPYKTEILNKVAELASAAGNAVVRSLTGTIGMTLLVIVQFFVLLYTMFFLLKDGKRMLDRILGYVPLPDSDKQRMVEKFVSVARATLKGTLFIGFIQGTLAGLAFWAVGIQGAVFWGTLMIILSIIPGIGGALVWVPAAIVLLVTGAIGRAVFLIAFCALVVGTIDNVLRPRLVGRDTQLHELMIFFSTIGGLVVFGPMGFIIGPIMAALFVTIWEIFGATYRTELDKASCRRMAPRTNPGIHFS